MTNVAEKIASFKERQAEIMKLDAQYNIKVDELKQDCENRIDAIKTEFEVKKAELSAEPSKAIEQYKADLKAEFGVTDGERANILDIVQLIDRVSARND